MNSLLNDFNTFKLFKSANTNEIQYFEDDITKKILLQIQPISLIELCAIFILVRPNSTKQLQTFIYNRKNQKEIYFIHPVVQKHTKETFGVFVFAEQIENIINDLTGFTFKECKIIRTVFGKRNHTEIDKYFKLFNEKCLQNEIFLNSCEKSNLNATEIITQIWNLLYINAIEVMPFDFVFKNVSDSYLQAMKLSRE